jgi:hypothetical protein
MVMAARRWLRPPDGCQQYKETARCRKMDYFHGCHPPDRYLADGPRAFWKIECFDAIHPAAQGVPDGAAALSEKGDSKLLNAHAIEKTI